MTSSNVHVVIGVIINDMDEALLSKRSTNVHQGGLWEFPGGKLEPGEDPRSALNRELMEELGVIVEKARPLIKVYYNYPVSPVLLDVWQIDTWHGNISGRENQTIKWFPVSDLAVLDFPAANKTILNAVKLPSIYLICPDPVDNEESYLATLDDCLKEGLRLLQFRCTNDLFQNHVILEMLERCNAYNAKLLLNSSPESAVKYNVHGVHLSSARLLESNQRPLDDNYLVAASCHNQNELDHACNIGVDFVVLSPVKRTNTHPEATPLGWSEFGKLVNNTTIPVYALGGMQASNMCASWKYGAQGIALMSGVWSAPIPSEIIRKCRSTTYL